ncbi:hypothetical protein [uncultured Cohaesibacter sp.]|uniref:hypothetical protein n=1 Tax=uncultured Cohaesibacter sp. TaxID=1002546 RepID=UPI0029304833|nr:hypothetical protein [uncultured Cohaesibacter sp.]
MKYLAAGTLIAALALSSTAMAFGNGYGMGQGRWISNTQTQAQTQAQTNTTQGWGRGMGRQFVRPNPSGQPVANGVGLLGQPRGGNRTGEPVFVDSWDENEDGIVSLAEAQERRGDYFDSLDDNEDGILVAAEFTEFLNNQRMAPEDATNGQRGLSGMSLAFNDINKDGKVEKAEFIKQTQLWLNGMDRNGDGQVSDADFGPRQAQMNGNRGYGQGRGMGRGNGRGMGGGMRWMQQQS